MWKDIVLIFYLLCVLDYLLIKPCYWHYNYLIFLKNIHEVFIERIYNSGGESPEKIKLIIDLWEGPHSINNIGPPHIVHSLVLSLYRKLIIFLAVRFIRDAARSNPYKITSSSFSFRFTALSISRFWFWGGGESYMLTITDFKYIK